MNLQERITYLQEGNRRMMAELAKMKTEEAEYQVAHGVPSWRKMRRTPDRFRNSNINGGGL